jgi:Leucine-rich repeat (LRR) protein
MLRCSLQCFLIINCYISGMTKNAVITILAIIVLGFGGWAIYSHTKHTTNPYSSSGSGTSQTTQGASDAKVLDYSHQGLSSVGPSIYNQTDATQLILSYNSLKSLPSQMGNLDKLQVLKVDHNLLQGALIAEIRKMPLVSLDVSYNSMTGIPAEIGQLSHLQTLNYSYNNINTVPNEIANLKQLKTLNLTGNPFTSSQISKLKSELPNTTIIF